MSFTIVSLSDAVYTAMFFFVAGFCWTFGGAVAGFVSKKFKLE